MQEEGNIIKQQYFCQKEKLSYTAILNSDLHHITVINEFDVFGNETNHGNEIEQEMD